jgi:putative transcriptional regulator
MKNNIRVERARVRMSQQELADKAGVIRQTIAAIEQGRFNPSTVLALKIAHLFSLSVEELFELEESDW